MVGIKPSQINVFVSACTLGRPLRWNGAHRKSTLLERWAKEHDVNLVPVCPEDDLMGTPRAAIHLAGDIEDIRVVTKSKKNRVDLTAGLKEVCQRLIDAHPECDGFIAMHRSPTCGTSAGVRTTKPGGFVTRGIFNQMVHDVALPVIQTNELKTKRTADNFLRKCREHMEKRTQEAEATSSPASSAEATSSVNATSSSSVKATSSSSVKATSSSAAEGVSSEHTERRSSFSSSDEDTSLCSSKHRRSESLSASSVGSQSSSASSVGSESSSASSIGSDHDSASSFSSSLLKADSSASSSKTESASSSTTESSTGHSAVIPSANVESSSASGFLKSAGGAIYRQFFG